MDTLEKLKKIISKDNVFLSGGAGVGKSYLLKRLFDEYRALDKKVITLGSTALAAFNVGGVTAHSFFALGLCKNLEELSRFDKKQKEKLVKLKKLLQGLDLIIIDEISMIAAELFELIAYRLRVNAFKGKILVVGDFFQLPPVVKKEDNSLFANSNFAFDALAWRDFSFKNLRLNVGKRTKNVEFYNHLSLLRQGQINEKSLAYFGNFLCSEAVINDDYTILCGINKRVDFINEQRLNLLKTPLQSFKAHIKKNDENLSDKSVRAWIKSLGINEELRLKKGAKIIFCMNNYEAGYYNGEQGVINDFSEDEDKKLIEILKSNGELVYLEAYQFTLEDLIEERTLASFTQFPIKLAYAMTIHKSQGMSIEKLVCDINHIFENGQLYVALSRAIEPRNLKILYNKREDFKSYFARALKSDERVREFYERTNFIDLE